jgi:hypothetical protein
MGVVNAFTEEIMGLNFYPWFCNRGVIHKKVWPIQMRSAECVKACRGVASTLLTGRFRFDIEGS